MSHSNSTAAPIGGKDRISSLDTVRGVALFGILLMNIAMFGLPSSYADPTVWGGATGANLWAWLTTTMVFEGTQRGMFSILFGAGMILLTSRLEAAGRDDVADIYYRRLLWLILFGIVHLYLVLWLGEILFLYGVAGLFLYPLRKLAPKVLLTMAAVAFVGGALWQIGETMSAETKLEKAVAARTLEEAGGELGDEQAADIAAWEEIEHELKPTEFMLGVDIAAHQGSYWDVLTFQAPVGAHIQSWMPYRYFYDILGMMLVGMALFRLGVLTLKQPARVYWTMVLIGYPIGLAVNYFEIQTILTGEFSIVAQLQANRTYDVGRLAMTAGHLGALLLFCRSGWIPWLQRSLAAVGRMALTNYVSHSVICAFVFYGFGFGLYGELERYQLYYVVFSVWVLQLIVSPIWLKHYRFGPLEWVWRSLTYLEMQPMRRVPSSGTPAAQTT